MAEWQRTRWAVLYNAATNRGVKLDMFAIRLFRMRRRLSAWANIVLDYRTEHPARLVMMTLTYKDVNGWRANHINYFMKNLKQRLDKKLLAFAWVAEIQKRGAIHYHLILLTEKGSQIPLPDKSGMWVHGISRIETARTPWYLLTYAGKEHQKDLARYPKGCWLYGASVRFGGDDTKALFRALAGLDVVEREGEIVGEVQEGKFEFIGSAVTESYADDVLMPVGAEILKRKSRLVKQES